MGNTNDHRKGLEDVPFAIQQKLELNSQRRHRLPFPRGSLRCVRALTD